MAFHIPSRYLLKSMHGLMSARPHTKINCAPMNIGNHLLAYLHAHYLKNLLATDTTIYVNAIPQLGVLSDTPSQPAITFKENKSADHNIYLRSRNRLLWPRIMVFISEITSTRIQISEPMMSIKRLPSLEQSRSLILGSNFFIQQALTYVSNFIDSHLFVNIRAGDIVNPIHPNYRPLTSAQIAEAALRSKKPLLFFGQTESSAYMSHIKNCFPGSIVINTGCRFTDFEINRVASTILIPISTFSWISTWLSEATNQIFYPNKGLYSRTERPDVYLVPRNDPRYIQLIS